MVFVHINPLRSRRLCGEYLTEFIKWQTYLAEEAPHAWSWGRIRATSRQPWLC